MSSRGLAGLLLGVVALLVVTGAAAGHRPRPRPVPGERAALAAVKRAVAAGRLSRAAAETDRAVISRSVHLVRVLPPSRRARVEVALEQAAALGRRLTSQRAVAVFGQLQANDEYFARHGVPRDRTDITGPDGIVYRYFAGRCFEFHPLANASALNARVAAKDVAGTERLAAALMARAVPRRGGGVAWEYYFPFGGGHPPWVSGMAQAVAAQAFARAASLATDESADLLREATAAFEAVPRLTTTVAAGPWIRLYSFSSLRVLNAQLQSVLSLETYAKATGDSAAAALASRLEQAAAATVSRFDTGYWTDYSLGGGPSPLSYQKFIVELLHRLAPEDPRFAEAAARFAAYLREPPAFKLANAPVGALRFWLSKPATVTVSTPGRTVRLGLHAGWHTVHLHEPKRPGFRRVHVTAVGWAGNRASFDALPIVRVPKTGRASPLLRRSSGTGGTSGVSPLAVGAGIDDSGQGALAASLGLGLVRMTTFWQPGQSAPDPATVASLNGLPPAVGLVLDLDAAQLPTGDAGRTALAGYASSLARQVPALHDLVLTPSPAREIAGRYAGALAAVGAAVAPVRPDVAVGPSFDGSTAKPQLTAIALGRQLAQDGTRPDLVSFLPAPVPGNGTWAVGDLGSLESALAKGLGTAPPVLLEAVPRPTRMPPSQQESAVSPATQASAYAAAVEAASCRPEVSALLLDRLVDGAAASTPATGLYDASGVPKPSAAAVAKAIRAVARGAVVCPGQAARVTSTTLTFPAQLSNSSAASVVLGCSRDCLYLVTLDRANGRPIVARHGALEGGNAAETIALPKRKLARGSYRLDVRLVSRFDPGVVKRVRSGLLSVG
ncbi:MAG TPA: D-glucuronyl C5-epimerase family protein [Gaiellaceae bacterium]|nr:D-glucuronyl C5-epimerase family protein [Gaiellaceae bacterium]